MLRPGSLTKTFDLYYSRDPGLHQPPPPPGEGSSAKDVAEHQRLVEEYKAKLTSARDTSEWSALIKPDGKPSKFVMQQIHRPTWRAVMDRASLSEDSPRFLGPNQVMAIAFRMAINSIPDLDVDLKHVPDKSLDGWKMAPESVIDVLDQYDPGIVGEMGLVLIQRMNSGVSPKS